MGSLVEKIKLLIIKKARNVVSGVYACVDSTSKIRTGANAVSMGTTAGIMLNKEYCDELFNV